MLSKFVNLQYTSLQQASRRIEFGQNYRQLQVLALAAHVIYVQFSGDLSLYKQPQVRLQKAELHGKLLILKTIKVGVERKLGRSEQRRLLWPVGKCWQ